MSNGLHDALLAPGLGSGAPFLIHPSGAVMTHAAFVARAATLAHALTCLGLNPGDRVAAQIDKSADALALYAACVMAGLVFLPLNPAYPPAEVRYFLEDAQAALLVAAPQAAPALAEVAGGAGLVTLGVDGDGTLADLAQGQPTQFRPVPRGLQDLAAILYTSGTTGRSKGAMLTQDNLLSNARVLAQVWEFTRSDVLLHALPVFHTHGLFVATNVTLLAGGAMILLPRFDAGQVMDLMPRATAMMGVPTFYSRLLTEPRLTPASVAHMRVFISGSAPLMPAVHQAFQAATGQAILERYGMTETSMIASNPLHGPRRAGRVGAALPGVSLRITGAGGAVLPPGQTGLVEVRGPNVFAGYWRMPEKTAEDLSPDGWFRTGDLGEIDATGSLAIVGRAKDLIIAGGLNIYPAEVEAALDALPGVAESAVIGLPHSDLGEAPFAVIVPRPGAAPQMPALLAALGGTLARFKIPRAGVVVADLPRNAMGKVQKAELRRQHHTAFSGTP